MSIIPAPGVALVVPLDEKSTSGLVMSNKKEGRIIKGKIVEMGQDDVNNYGAVIKAENYGKTGDIIYFLSYYDEGGYDQVKIDNTRYYIVKFGDFRLTIKND